MKARTEAGDPLPPCVRKAPITRVAPRGGSWPRLHRFSQHNSWLLQRSPVDGKGRVSTPIHAVGVYPNAHGAPLSEQHPQGFDAKPREVKDPVVAISQVSLRVRPLLVPAGVEQRQGSGRYGSVFFLPFQQHVYTEAVIGVGRSPFLNVYDYSGSHESRRWIPVYTHASRMKSRGGVNVSAGVFAKGKAAKVETVPVQGGHFFNFQLRVAGPLRDVLVQGVAEVDYLVELQECLRGF